MTILSLHASADISAFQSGQELVAFNAGPDGAVYALFAQTRLNYRTGGKTGASFAVTQPAQTPTYRAVAIRDGVVELDLTISGENFNIHHLQPLGELLLLVCARTNFRGGKPEQNGRLYSRDGVFVGALLLGDGIQDVQTTADGTIWTSYFDEGIFGNRGWDRPVGAAGLVAFDQTGTRLYEFEPAGGLDQICDCYAMNAASSEDIWLCYYTDFPLVHLRKRNVIGNWQAPVGGSSAFAVDTGYCLFQGGYQKRDEYVLAELGATDKQPRVVKRFQLTDGEQEPLSAIRTTARAERMHILAGTKLYQLDVSSAFAAA